MPALARTLALTALPVLALVACHAATPEPAGKVSTGEAKALDEAAAMLDAPRLPPESPPAQGAAPPAELTGDTAPARP